MGPLTEAYERLQAMLPTDPVARRIVQSGRARMSQGTWDALVVRFRDPVVTAPNPTGRLSYMGIVITIDNELPFGAFAEVES